MAKYMIDMTEVVGIEQNLNTVASSLGNMNQKFHDVSDSMTLVNDKVNDVSKEVNDLNAKLEKFMQEIKGNTVVTNAKQSIMLSNQEIDKNYKHYDNVRRHVNGILQSLDMQVIKKDTLTRVSDEILLKTPSYWLAKSLKALVEWINNNKDLADKALSESMNLNDENTSLFFFLICLRLKRMDSARIWFNRYLEMQDPLHLDNKIINIFNSMISGIYGYEIKKDFMHYIDKWQKELKSRAGIVDSKIDRWSLFIDEKKYEIILLDNLFPYLSKTETWSYLKNRITDAILFKDLYDYFSNIFEQKEEIIPNYVTQVDLMLEDLISNYDEKEGKIQNEILKNKIIIEENGDIEKANIRFNKEKTFFQDNKDLFQHLTDISLFPERTNAIHTLRKFAIAFSKDWIIAACNQKKFNNSYLEIKLKISDWEGITKDGSNEGELRRSLNMYYDKLFHNEIYSDKYLNSKTIIGIFLILAGIIVGVLLSKFAYLVSIIGLIICFIDIKSVYDSRESKLKNVKEKKKTANIILGNNISEIVEYLKYIKAGEEYKNKLLSYLNGLEIKSYMLNTNDDMFKRKVMVGEDNE